MILSTFPGLDMSSTFPGLDMSSTMPIMCNRYYPIQCNHIISGRRTPEETICITLGLSTPSEDVQFSNCGSSFDTTMSVYEFDFVNQRATSKSFCDGDDCGQCSNGNSHRENFIIPSHMLYSPEYTIVLDAFDDSTDGYFEVEVNCGDQIEYPMFSSTTDDEITCDRLETATCNSNVQGYRKPYETICILLTLDQSRLPEDVQFSSCGSAFDTTMRVYEDIYDPFAISDSECDGDDCGKCSNGNGNRENFILDSLDMDEYTIVLDAFRELDSGSFKVEINCGDEIEYPWTGFPWSTMESTWETDETIDTSTTEYEPDEDTTTTKYESDEDTTTTVDDSCTNPSNFAWDLFNGACRICLRNKQNEEDCKNIVKGLPDEYIECFKDACPNLNCEFGDDFENIKMEQNRGKCDCDSFQCIGSGNTGSAYEYNLKMNMMVILVVVYFVFQSV